MAPAGRVPLLPCALALLGALLAGGPAAADDELAVLSYNTHGLSAWVAGDDPERRFPLIGRRAGAYDVALLQEDFAHHERLLAEAAPAIVRRGNGSRKRWCPICSGAGLTFLSRLPEAALLDVRSAPYGTCAGWLGGANDCLADKGYQLLALRLASGAVVHLANTHLDAGRDESDRAARRRQLGTLRAAIERHVGDGALIVGGDFNLAADDPGDVEILEGFSAALGLSDSGAGARPGSGWEVLDYLLYRSGGGVALEVAEAGEDPSFAAGGVALSDHPAIFARFRVTRAEGADAGAPASSASSTSRRPPE